MRLLVTGAGGQLGRAVVAAAHAAGDEVLSADRATLDVTDRDAVLSAVTTWRPDAVVNCAAWTAVDACESDPERAFLDNAVAVRWLAEAAHLAGSHLVQLSTEYVFDGCDDHPYREWDTTAPLSVYGAAKLGGETEALALGTSAAVVRTSWVCGEHGTNMVRTVLRLLDDSAPLVFVDDQRGCPTFTADLAPVLRRIALERRGGVHHLTNGEAMSWFDFVRRIVSAAGGDPDAVSAITTAELDPPRPAERPVNGVLADTVLRASGWPPLRDVDDALADLVATLRA